VSTPVVRADHPVPPQLDRLQRGAAVAAAVGILALLLGLVLDPTQFFRSYLLAYLFWIGIGVGCLSIAMIHHLSGGAWGVVIRRILEAGARTLRFAALFFLPLAFGLPRIYEWAGPEAAHDEILKHKSLYLNAPFFLGRAAFYFVVWGLLAHYLNKWSLEMDRGPDARLSQRLEALSGGGLVLMGLTITFSAVDWAMSLDPHWFSTIYGMLFMIGQALSALAMVIVLVSLIGNEPPLLGVVRPSMIHDLGKLLLAFVMVWAYISFSQFLIVWSGNLPEEIPWYIRRLGSGWQWLALILVVFHFALPFLLLLSRDLKRNARTLGMVAAGVLVVRLVDLFWLVGPDLKGHGHGLAVHWMDLAAAVALGGAWLWTFAGHLKDRPLLPLGEPELREMLEAAEAHG
jgi:hypothetical protein